MHILNASHRCDLFKQIADEVWKHIINNHTYSTQVSEIGITNDIIATIKRHASTIPNFGVWARHGINEKKYGSDIDIFVETVKGQFVWYALQAKVLRIGNKYDKLSNIHGTNYQWDKLDLLNALTGCITKYLFYNGVKDYSFKGTDSCNLIFIESQFGCSLVECSVVKRISLKKTNPSFFDFHPKYADPWRTIVCCYKDVKSTLFSLTQIKDAVSYYEKDFGADLITTSDDILPLNDSPVSIIHNSNQEVGRDPIFSVVIRTTESLNT